MGGIRLWRAATSTISGIVTTAAQTLAGVKTFADGLKFDDAAGQTTVNYYKESTQTLTFSGLTTSPTNDLDAVRIGNMVWLKIPNSGSRTKDGSAGNVTLGTLDSEFRPSATVSFVTVGNTSGISAGGGINMYLIQIANTGVITIQCINTAYAQQTFAAGATVVYYGLVAFYHT